MKLNNIAKISAIIGAFIIFLLSTFKLINFAINQNAINRSDSKIIEFVINNYKDLNIISIILIFTITLIILASYFEYTKKNNQKISKYLIPLLLFIFLLSTITDLSRFIDFLDPISVKATTIKIILSLSSILFATSLLFYKNNRKKAILIIAPLYIINSLFILSTSFLPVQLLDLTIAIKVAESVFFHQESKNA